MPAIYHPGVVQFAAHYDIGGPHDAVNVLYYRTAAIGLTSAQLTTVQGVFDTNWKTFWGTVGVNSTNYKGSIVTDMASNTGLQVDNSAYTPSGGGITGVAMSDGTAALISLHTLTRYRGGHGRIYLPGVGQTATNGDGRTLASINLTTLVTRWNALITAMSGVAGSAGGPYNPIVWHKKLATAPNTVEDILSITAQSVLATQRRRLRKVSRHRRRL